MMLITLGKELKHRPVKDHMGVGIADGRVKECEGTLRRLLADIGDHRRNYETPRNRTNRCGQC